MALSADFEAKARLRYGAALTAIGTALAMMPSPAKADCVIGGPGDTILTCDGDISGGRGRISDTVTTVIFENLTTNVGGRGFFLRQSAGLDVTVDADLGNFRIELMPPDERDDTRIAGFHIITDGAVSGRLVGDIVGQTQADYIERNGSRQFRNFGALGFEVGGAIDFTHVGDIDVARPVFSAENTFRADITLGRFGAIRMENLTGDIMLDNTGFLALDGGTRNVTVINTTGGSAGGRTIRFSNAVTENHGIYAEGFEDLVISQIGDIRITGGAANVFTSSENNTADAQARFSRLGGIYAPSFFSFGDPDAVLPGFQNVDVVMDGDIAITGADISIEAVSTSTDADLRQGMAIADGGSFSGQDAQGILLSVDSDDSDNGSIRLDYTGDIVVIGGSGSAEATASLGGDDETAGLIVARSRGQDAQAISFFSALNAELSFDGSIDITGGDARAVGTGAGTAMMGTLYSDVNDFTPRYAVDAEGGDARGTDVRGAFALDLAFSGPTTVRGGNGVAIANGRDYEARSVGGLASAISLDFGFSEMAAPIEFSFEDQITAFGGDARLEITGENIAGLVTGGSGFGGGVTMSNDAVYRHVGNVLAIGGDVELINNPDNEGEVDVRGGAAIGLFFNPASSEGSTIAPRFIVEGLVQAIGGDISITGPSASAFAGGAIGIQFPFGSGPALPTIEIQSRVEAIGGNGPNGRGSARGIDMSARAAVIVSGSLVVEGGQESAGIFIEDIFGFSEDLELQLTVDGGEILVDGPSGFGINTAALNSTIDLVNGGSIVVAGTDTLGVFLRAGFDAFEGINGPSNNTILIDETSFITADGTGIRDQETATNFEFVDGEVIETEVPTLNTTSVDLAGTVTGNGGTAIDLSNGDDVFLLRATGIANGDVLLGEDADRAETEAGGRVDGALDLGGGDDIATIAGGTVVTGDFLGGTGSDTVSIAEDHAIAGAISLGAGEDVFLLGMLSSSVAADGGADNDTALFTTVEGDDLIVDLNDFAFTSIETFAQEGPGTLTADADGGIFSRYEVRGGTFTANGDLPMLDVFVEEGGVFMGSGTVGALTLTGGTLAPGNSIGSLTTGDLTLDANSIFEVEVDDMGGNDVVIVNGTVTLGDATLRILDMAGGDFTGADPFDFLIIDNDGTDAVMGEFGAITNELAFLTPTVDYADGDGNDVGLALTPNNVAPPPPPPPPGPPSPPPPPPPSAPLFPTAAVTYNERGAANGLDDFDRTAGSDAAAVYMQILFMTALQARTAFNAASGEIYASLLANDLDDAMVRTDRLVARAHETSGEGWGVWGGVTSGDGSTDGDGNAASADGDSFGVDFGIDYRGPANRWAVGATIGHVDGGLDIDARRSTADFDGWHLGGFGRYGTGNGGITVTGAFSYSNLEADVRRNIAFGTVSRSTRANVDVETFSLEGELRYGVALGDGGWAAGPVASVFFADGELGIFGEIGADSLNLTSRGSSDDLTRFGGGAFVNWQGDKGSLDMSAQYVDGHSNVSQVDLRLAGAPASAFPVRSPRTNGSAGLFSVAGRYDLGGGWSIGGDVRGLIGTDERGLAGSAVIGWRF